MGVTWRDSYWCDSISAPSRMQFRNRSDRRARFISADTTARHRCEVAQSADSANGPCCATSEGARMRPSNSKQDFPHLLRRFFEVSRCRGVKCEISHCDSGQNFRYFPMQSHLRAACPGGRSSLARWLLRSGGFPTAGLGRPETRPAVRTTTFQTAPVCCRSGPRPERPVLGGRLAGEATTQGFGVDG